METSPIGVKANLSQNILKEKTRRVERVYKVISEKIIGYSKIKISELNKLISIMEGK